MAIVIAWHDEDRNPLGELPQRSHCYRVVSSDLRAHLAGRSARRRVDGKSDLAGEIFQPSRGREHRREVEGIAEKHQFGVRFLREEATDLRDRFSLPVIVEEPPVRLRVEVQVAEREGRHGPAAYLSSSEFGTSGGGIATAWPRVSPTS